VARIAVLIHDQRETDRPRHYVKRSAGQNLVKRALAVWVVKNRVLRMLPPRQGLQLPVEPKFYLPEKLPPIELPGLRWEDPRGPVKPLPAWLVDRALREYLSGRTDDRSVESK
jgi:hypothetical protein